MKAPLLTDIEAYPQYPWARWVYNKLLLSHALQYECAPHGINPTTFPVFSKPIMNLEGMALGSKVWCSADDIEYIAGHLFYSVPVWWKKLPKDIAIPKNNCYVKDVCGDITNQTLEIKRSHIILCEDLTEGLALRDKIISNN